MSSGQFDLGLVKHAKTLHTLRTGTIVERQPEKPARRNPTPKPPSPSPPKSDRRGSSKTKESKKQPIGVLTQRTKKQQPYIHNPDPANEVLLSSENNDDRPQAKERRQSKPKKGKEKPNVSFMSSLTQRIMTPFKGQASGKQSAMSRELNALNLSANKEYDFMYDDSYRKRSENVAMDDPDEIWLRPRGSDRRYAAPKRDRKKNKQNNGDCCGMDCGVLSEMNNQFGLCPILIVLLMLVVYLWFSIPTPYCDAGQNSSHCSPGGWYWPLECRPCPDNAHCSQGHMRCLGGYNDVGGELCLDDDLNPWIERIVTFFQRVDNGIKWNQNFKHFGAAHPQQINGKEVMDQLDLKDARERILAGNALVKVFTASNTEQPGIQSNKYCLADKFVALKDPTTYVDWDDIKIGSPKLGLPITPEGGAKEHN